jgi:predicted RNA polymerase sigma factor
LLQHKNYEEVELKLESINALLLEQKQHLYHAVYTDFYISQNKIDKVKESIQLTIKLSQNEKEKQYFIKKFASII